MRILLDESLLRSLRRVFAGHEVVIVEVGWSAFESAQEGEAIFLAFVRI